jgi:putative ABC transport system ATP-binding protein
VAVARALAASPRALLADEPTGNLDEDTGDRLHALVRSLNREKGITVVIVTHNERLAAACDRRLRLEGGRLHDGKASSAGVRAVGGA